MAIHRRRSTGVDRGAAAVEFALVCLPLLILVLGLIDFGRAYNEQETLTQAARVGARLAIVGNTTSVVQAAVVNAAHPSVNISASAVTVTPDCNGACGTGINSCSTGATAMKVEAVESFRYLSPLFKNGINISGTATAPC